MAAPTWSIGSLASVGCLRSVASSGSILSVGSTVRTVFIVGPGKRVRLMMTSPMSVGRNFAEIIRALDAVQQTDGASS